MAFCTNCGQQVADGAKFCANCGTPVSQNVANTERKTVFDGEIHKCPHCGEVLKAFETVCPTCKFELRGAQGSSAVKDLAEKLENATSEKQRIIIIKNFPVPNTKEDIFEFMLLASSNFDAEYYTSHLDEDDITDAWLAKIDLCYKKAQLMLSNNEIQSFEKIYLEIKSNISKTQSKHKNRTITSVMFIGGGLLLVLTQILPIATVGLVLLTVGIVRLATNKRKAKTEVIHEKHSRKTGFSSWSTTAKVLWIILNIYTIGIPAIIYACHKKN